MNKQSYLKRSSLQKTNNFSFTIPLIKGENVYNFCDRTFTYTLLIIKFNHKKATKCLQFLSQSSYIDIFNVINFHV